MTVCIDGVEVALGRDEDDPRITGFYVYVHCRAQPQHQARAWVNPAEMGSARATLAGIIAAAIASAEYIGKKYDEPVCPGAVARNAREAMERELRLMAEMSGGIQRTIKLLWEKRASLDNQAMDVLDRARWAMNQGLPLTVNEMVSLTNILGVVLSPDRAGG